MEVVGWGLEELMGSLDTTVDVGMRSRECDFVPRLVFLGT